MMTVREFIMNDPDFHDERVKILLWAVKIFMMTGRDFHDARSRFSWWQVEILIITDRDFIMNSWNFYDDRQRFSWWHVEVYMITGRVLHDDRFKFSWCHVLIFGVSGRYFIMNGWDFHSNMSRFSWVKIFMMAGRDFFLIKLANRQKCQEPDFWKNKLFRIKLQHMKNTAVESNEEK